MSSAYEDQFGGEDYDLAVPYEPASPPPVWLDGVARSVTEAASAAGAAAAQAALQGPLADLAAEANMRQRRESAALVEAAAERLEKRGYAEFRVDAEDPQGFGGWLARAVPRLDDSTVETLTDSLETAYSNYLTELRRETERVESSRHRQVLRELHATRPGRFNFDDVRQAISDL